MNNVDSNTSSYRPAFLSHFERKEKDLSAAAAAAGVCTPGSGAMATGGHAVAVNPDQPVNAAHTYTQYFAEGKFDFVRIHLCYSADALYRYMMYIVHVLIIEDLYSYNICHSIFVQQSIWSNLWSNMYILILYIYIILYI